MAKSKVGMGFNAAALSAGNGNIAKGDRIIAASTRKAKKNPAAVRRNPNLLKVK